MLLPLSKFLCLLPLFCPSRRDFWLIVLRLQTSSFAAVIFRRIASKTRKNDRGDLVDMFLSLSKDQAAVIRQKLLESLGGDFQRVVRNKISDAVAEVARQYTENSTFRPCELPHADVSEKQPRRP